MAEKKTKKVVKKTRNPPKKLQGSTDCTQSVIKRGARGRFAKGCGVPNGFNKHPENIYNIADDDNFNPKHSPRFQLRKLWSVPTDEVEKRMQDAKNNKKTPYGEYLALAQASRAVKSTKYFVETMNQADGAPTQPINMDIHEEKPSPYDDLTIEELRKLLGEDE